MKNLLLTLLSLLFSMTAFSQSVSLKGKIIDLENKALPGAHVSLEYPWAIRSNQVSAMTPEILF